MLHVVLPILDTDNVEGGCKQIANGMGFTGGDDVVVSLRLLQHPPHGIHIITRISPVAARLEVAHQELVQQPEFDGRDSERHLSGDEFDASSRRFVIEEHAAGGVHPIGFPVVDGHVMAENLGHAVR